MYFFVFMYLNMFLILKYIPRYLLFLNTHTGTYDYFELLQIFFLKPRIKKYYFVDKESIRLQIQLFIRLLYFHSFFIYI